MPYIFPLHLSSCFIFYIKNANHSKNVQSSHDQICNPITPASNLLTEEMGEIFFLLATVTLLLLYDFISLVIFSVLASLSSFSLSLSVSLFMSLTLSLSPKWLSYDRGHSFTTCFTSWHTYKVIIILNHTVENWWDCPSTETGGSSFLRSSDFSPIYGFSRNHIWMWE